MRSVDVLRGCLMAYLICVLCGALIATVASGNPLDWLNDLFISFLIFGGYGLIVLLPVVGIAFASFATLRQVLDRARWWQSLLVVFGWAVLLMMAVGAGFGGLIWASAIGLVAGSAFWVGAAGWRWSVPLDSP